VTNGGGAGGLTVINLTNMVPYTNTAAAGYPSNLVYSFVTTGNANGVQFLVTNISTNGNLELLADTNVFPTPEDFYVGSFDPGTNNQYISLGTNSGLSFETNITWYLTVPNTSANNVKYSITAIGGQPDQLIWNNAQGNGQWDVQVSRNWSNVNTGAAEAYFLSFDYVTFDDSILKSAHPTTSVGIAAGQVVIPTVMRDNSTNNYTISGAGKISGETSIVKLGSGTLTITTSNDFTGDVTIAGGTLKAGPAASLGASNGTVYVTNGATLDIDYSLLGKPLVLFGAGVNGAGALVNNDPSLTAISDNPGGLLNVALAGDATIGGSNRLDFGQFSPGGGRVRTGGSNYNLTVVGTAYREWDNVIFGGNFGNINVETTGGGAVVIKGATSLGNPANTLAVFSNAIVGLTNDADNVTLNKNIMLYGGSAFINNGGFNFILSPVTLGVTNGDNCAIAVVGVSSLTLNNIVGGPGNLVKTGPGPLFLNAADTYSGNTELLAGFLFLINDGSISDSTNIILEAGTVLDVSARTDQTLTLSAGQTLQGIGAVNGNLTVNSNATVAPSSPGVIGTLTVTSQVSLSGTTVMDVNAATGTNDQITCAGVTYGGILSVTNLAGTLAASNTFQIFNSSSASYAGSFNSITPPIPGPGLQWDISQLDISGTLGVMPGPPIFTSITYSSGNLVMSGSNGPPFQTYYVLATTNLDIPITNWMVIATNTFGANGDFSITNALGTNSPPQEFFELETQ